MWEMLTAQIKEEIISLGFLWPLPFPVDCPRTFFQSHRKSLAQALCVGFAPKQTKESTDWRSPIPTPTEMNTLPSCYSMPKNSQRNRRDLARGPAEQESYCILNKTNQLIGLVGRVFTTGPGWGLVSIPGRVIPNTLKMVLDTSLLKTQQYKSKVEQSKERGSALPYTSVL